MRKSQFKTADDLAAFKYGVISPLVSRPEEYDSDSAFFAAAAAMASMASTGYLPAAVSPESMMAEEPS